MNKNLVIVLVLAALVIVSAIQAFQLNSLKDRVETSTLAIGTASGKAPQVTASGGSQAPLPSNLQDLPSMVGGC